MGRTVLDLPVPDAVKRILRQSIAVAIKKIAAEKPTFLVDVRDRPASFDAIVALHWEAACRLARDEGEDLAHFPTKEEFADLLIEDQRIFADQFEQDP